MKKKIIKVLVVGVSIICSLVLIGIVGVSIFTGHAMMEGAMKMKTNEETKESSVKFLEEIDFAIEEDMKMYLQYKEEISIPSSKYDHTITADYITSSGNKKNDTIILVHGHGGDRMTMYPIAKMFLDNGYNVLAYDQRNAGGNNAEYTTFGYLESEDLQDCVDFIRTQVGEDKKVGILGQSMGGATTGFYAGKEHANKNVDFIILDGPFNDMYEMIELAMKSMGGNEPIEYLMGCGSIGTKLKLGFSYKDMNVADSIKHTTIPTLMIHSKTDEVCTYKMGETIFNAIPHNNKKLYTLEDVEHIMGYYVDPEGYTKEVMSFIE